MKTAVEQFWNDLGDIKNNVPYEKQVDEILKCYYKAKEMEKEQIIESYSSGYTDASNEYRFNRDYYNTKYTLKRD